MAGGRPSKMTKEVLGKLEEAYLSDATHLEAAIYAGIDESTLHDWRKANPELSKRFEALRKMTGLKAKNNIRKKIEEEGKNKYNDDGELISQGTGTSKWWLERRDPDFKNVSKTELEHTGNKSLIDAILAKKKAGKG